MLLWDGEDERETTVTEAERELLEACAHALLNFGWHLDQLRQEPARRGRWTVLNGEIGGHLEQINAAIGALEAERKKAPGAPEPR